MANEQTQTVTKNVIDLSYPCPYIQTVGQDNQIETVHATISQYEDRGSYVWVDTPDGEELAQALEAHGSKVTRVSSQTEQGSEQ